MLEEEAVTTQSLTAAVNDLYASRGRYIEAMTKSSGTYSIRVITDLIEKCRLKR